MLKSDFLLEQYYETFYSEGQIDISCSGIEPYTLADLNDLFPLLNIEIPRILLDYSSVAGQTAIRERIAALYHCSVHPDDVLITNGALEALSLLVLYFGKLKGNIIVCNPFFAPLSILPSNNQIEIRNVATYSRMKFDINALLDAIDSDTRAIILNNPNNPLGISICADELKLIVRHAKKVGAMVIVDEVGLLMQSSLKDIMSIVEIDKEMIGVGSMSKVFGTPGLRIGWLIISSVEMRLSLSELKQQLSGSTSIVAQQIASCILNEADRIVRKHMEIVERNREKLKSFLKGRSDIKCRIPMCGCTCILELNHAINASRIAKILREEYKLFTAPGEIFGVDNSLRLGLGLRTTDINFFFDILNDVCK